MHAAGSVQPASYSPSQAGQLFLDAGMPLAQQLGPLLIGNFSGNNSLPHTNFYGFIGTGEGLGFSACAQQPAASQPPAWP